MQLTERRRSQEHLGKSVAVGRLVGIGRIRDRATYLSVAREQGGEARDLGGNTYRTGTADWMRIARRTVGIPSCCRVRCPDADAHADAHAHAHAHAALVVFFGRSNGCSMMLNLWLVRAVYQALRAKRSVKILQNSPAPIWTSVSCHMLMGPQAR